MRERFWFRFTCKPVYRVVRLRMEVLLTSIVVHCTSVRTMRMQKCSSELHLRCVLSLRRSFWKLPVETFARMFTRSYTKYARFRTPRLAMISTWIVRHDFSLSDLSKRYNRSLDMFRSMRLSMSLSIMFSKIKEYIFMLFRIPAVRDVLKDGQYLYLLFIIRMKSSVEAFIF